MKMIKRKINNGFSVVEIVIYLAIFTVMSVVVINSFLVILSSFSSIRSDHNLLNSGNMAMERISREIRQAKNIDVANTTSEILQLNSIDESNNSVVIKFAKVGNALNIYKDGTSIGNLLVPGINLNSLSFDRIVTVKGEAVKIKIILQDPKSKTEKIENFYNTVILRGGY